MSNVLTMERKLANGATVIAQYQDVVLCKWGKEYVTWRMDARGDTYCGHYFQDIANAKKDFFERV